MNLLLYLTLKFEFNSTEALSPTKIQKQYFGGGREGAAKATIYMCYILKEKISNRISQKYINVKYEKYFNLTSLTHP